MKKIITLITMFVCCLALTSCKYIEGTTQVALRIGTDSQNKFNETIMVVPVGEESSISVTTKLQSNKQKKIVCKIIVNMEKSDIIDYEENYTTGCLKNSIHISDDKKSIEYQAEVSKNTKDIAIKLLYNFVASETGEAKITVTVYDHKGEKIISACSEKNIRFE